MNELIEYIKNRKGNRIGVVVASVGPHEGQDQIVIGWSLCKVSKDKFDQDRALTIARGRAKTGTSANIPQTVMPYFNHMLERSAKYFKGKEVSYWFIPDNAIPMPTKAWQFQNIW